MKPFHSYEGSSSPIVAMLCNRFAINLKSHITFKAYKWNTRQWLYGLPPPWDAIPQPIFPNRLCEHNTADSVWIWQMLLTREGQLWHPTWQFWKRPHFPAPIVCMAIASAMNWNHIIQQIPEHQLRRLRRRQGKWGSLRLPRSLIHLLRWGKGRIMIPAHQLSSPDRISREIIWGKRWETGVARYGEYQWTPLKSRVYITR